MSMYDDFSGDDGDGGEPEIWDEFQWEEFMRESDRRTKKYARLMQQYKDHPERDKIIAKEMGWNWLLEALEEQENEESPEEDEDAPDFDETEEGEDWKQATGYIDMEFEDFSEFPLYQLAFQYSLDAHKFIRENLDDSDEECVGIFVGSATLPAAKIAGGFGLGFEMETLGGNIANCKRGLAAANRALEALQQMREQELIDEVNFRDLCEKGKQVRDELGVYIVELRERFQRGIS